MSKKPSAAAVHEARITQLKAWLTRPHLKRSIIDDYRAQLLIAQKLLKTALSRQDKKHAPKSNCENL